MERNVLQVVPLAVRNVVFLCSEVLYFFFAVRNVTKGSVLGLQGLERLFQHRTW